MVKPKPGDLVCARTTDDVLIKRDSCGVIEGKAGKRKKRYSVLFNPSPMPWWDKGYISSSGGPSRTIASKDMRYTGKKRKVNFQYFPGLPSAGAARTKKRTVNVFETDLR